MDLSEIRKTLKTRSIYDLPLRVTFYARVSSDSDAQLNSLENQTAFFTDFIKKAGAWKLVPGYIDEGITGITTRKREDFRRMLDDAQSGKFDLIITKEISRFARNTIDSIQNTRNLLSWGVGVIFQNDSINTLDEDSEFRLTIMAGVAQEEVRKLSSRVKFGHKQAIKSGVVLGNSRIYGYTLSGGKLTIDEKEAELVRELFELYATGAYTMKKLERYFYDKGYRNHAGNMLSHATMARMIRNPKYKGWYTGGKVQVVDLFTKKQKFLPPEQWTTYKDETGETVPAIVSEQLWNTANDVIAVRSADVIQRQNKTTHGNLLTGKLYCGECGSPFYRKESRRKYNPDSRWACSGILKHGKEFCHAVYIRESDIVPVIEETLRDGTDDHTGAIEALIEGYKAANASSNLPAKMRSAESEVADIEARKMKLLSLCAGGLISDSDFSRMNEALTVELETCTSKIEALKTQEKELGKIDDKIRLIREAFEAARKAAATGTIDRQFVEKYIDRVTVYPPVDGTISVEIALLTGKKVSASIIRPGTIVKKMIEAQERAMSGR